MVRVVENKVDSYGWLLNLLERRNKNIAAVALANKNARIIWALLAHGDTFQPAYTKATAVAMV